MALLSGCAASDAQRSVLATALGLEAGATAILVNHGVLLDAHVGTFTPEDYAVIESTLALVPEPVKDVLNLIVLDEALPFPVFAGYSSGGIIVLAGHAGNPGGFLPYPSGRQLPEVADSLQNLLIHEIGHMCDSLSVDHEESRWEAIYAAGASDPDAFIYGEIFTPQTEDIIFYFTGYCTDSSTILAEEEARGNAVLSQKLAHTIDMLPSVVRDHVPFFTTDPVTHITETSLSPATRASGAVLGDDGMITSVNGVTF